MNLSEFPRHTRTWNAKWIWGNFPGHEKNVYCYFRKTFDLKTALNDAVLFIAADTRYQLFINGTWVGRGAPQSQPFYQYFDKRDVSDLLKKGENTVSVIVNYVGNLPDTQAGLLCEIVSDGDTLLTTDGSWKSQRAYAWEQNTHCFGSNKTTPYQEFFDARKAPAGWTETGFDDSAWDNASVINPGRGMTSMVGPWARLVERDIPFMKEEPVLPKTVAGIEETLYLCNRPSRNDLAPTLSQVGTELKYTKVENADNFCTEDGETVIQCSTEHLKSFDFDGLYTPNILLDFGKIVTARSRITLKGVDGGIAEIGYAERLIDGRFNIAIEGAFADRYTMKDGEHRFESFTWKSFRYLRIRFRDCFEPVTVRKLEAVISTYPYEDKGGFESNDECLNKIYDISQYTARLCSNEFLMDTPWREQAQWLGDIALATVPAILSSFGDPRLTRKFFMQAGQNQHQTGMVSNVSNIVNHGWRGSIPDYSLWWIWGLHLQYMHTGDEELLHRLYPQALRVFDGHLDFLNDEGLIEDMPYWVFIDWAHTDRRGVCTAYNAVFYMALEKLKAMAEIRGDQYAVKSVEGVMRKIKENFHRVCYDPDRNCYADAVIHGEFSDLVSEHGNMAAVAAGLCDEKTAQQVITTVFDEDNDLKFTEAQPFFFTVVQHALRQSDRFDLALKLTKDRYGKRMVDKGYHSVLEEWYENGSWRDGDFSGFIRTHSHAWSACPADFLIRGLMGLEILEAGCTEVKVTPQKTDFDYKAVYPAPQGPIVVENKKGTISVSVPDGVTLTESH